MTTEVAIINKEAIALAADSAVTVKMSDGTKIYNSANKLFALSRFQPVGVMVYGGAELTGVPWETLIKVYRKQLGKQSFSTLIDYCNDFIKFLEKNTDFFLEREQLASIDHSVIYRFEEIRNGIIDAVGKAFEKTKVAQKGNLPQAEIDKIVDNLIEDHYQNLENKNTLPFASSAFIDEVTDKHKQKFLHLIRVIFEQLPISKKSTDKLVKIAVNSLVKEVFSPSISGIVIAGFGEQEIFPSLQTYNIECVFENKLKFYKNQDKSHDIGNYPVIIPFAQEDMIFTFIEGVDPRLEMISLNVLDQILQNHFETLIKINNLEKLKEASATDQDQTGNLNDESAVTSQVVQVVDELNKVFDSTRKALLEKYRQKMIEYKMRYHVSPILTTVSILPKDELGAMAEALVNLTSLKRRVTTDEETVGGPTDVALISKGDGFVWIKRKHYFKPELNPDLFAAKTLMNFVGDSIKDEEESISS